jgi:hypothetical protein
VNELQYNIATTRKDLQVMSLDIKQLEKEVANLAPVGSIFSGLFFFS